jgi:hypothetical protein
MKKSIFILLFSLIGLSSFARTDSSEVSEKDTTHYYALVDSSLLHFYEYDFSIDYDNCMLYEELNEWLGTKYKYAGNSQSGIDCSGLMKHFYSKFYELELQGGSANIYPLTKPVSKDSLQEGDLIFFKIRGNRISHVGMYLQNGYFVHASVHSGVTISHLSEAYYEKYYYAAGTFRE